MNLKFLIKNIKFNKDDVVKFYSLYEKINPISDTICVISKNFKQTYIYLKLKYKKDYTIIGNDKLETIVVLKENFVEKYIIINDLKKLIDCEYKFKKII